MVAKAAPVKNADSVKTYLHNINRVNESDRNNSCSSRHANLSQQRRWGGASGGGKSFWLCLEAHGREVVVGDALGLEGVVHSKL